MNIVQVDLDALDLRYAKLRTKRPAVEKRLLVSLAQLPHCFEQFGGIVSVSPWFSSRDGCDFQNSD
jgi:hypothetical protein